MAVPYMSVTDRSLFSLSPYLPDLRVPPPPIVNCESCFATHVIHVAILAFYNCYSLILNSPNSQEEASHQTSSQGSPCDYRRRSSWYGRRSCHPCLRSPLANPSDRRRRQLWGTGLTRGKWTHASTIHPPPSEQGTLVAQARTTSADDEPRGQHSQAFLAFP